MIVNASIDALYKQLTQHYAAFDTRIQLLANSSNTSDRLDEVTMQVNAY